METLRAKIERLNAELAEINMHEVITQDLTNRKNQIVNDLSDAEYQLKLQQEHQQEQEVREQQFVEHIDGLMEAVQKLGLFEALVAKPEDGERIHEYDDRRKETQLIIHDFALLQLDVQKSRHNDEIAAKNAELAKVREELRAAGERETILQRNYDELQKEVEFKNTETVHFREQLVQEQTEHGSTLELLNETKNRLNTAQAKIDELQQKLLEANKPKEYTAPSESLADRVANLKVRSLKDLSPDEMIRRFEERQASGGKVALTAPEFPVLKSVTQGVAQTGNTFPAQAEPKNDQLLPAQEVTKEGVTFPTSEQSDGLSMDRNGAVQEIDGQAVTREEFEALKSRVDALETSKGMVA